MIESGTTLLIASEERFLTFERELKKQKKNKKRVPFYVFRPVSECLVSLGRYRSKSLIGVAMV
jgi:hypothetical protein